MPQDASHLDNGPPSPATYDATLARFERDIVRAVGEEMRGEDPAAVYAVLVEWIHHRLPAVDLDDLDLRTIAEAIANDGPLP